LPIDTLDLLEEERGMKIDVDRATTLDWDSVRAAIKEHGMRNSNTMAIAPTATISNIAGCVPTIEPIYKNIYAKSNQGGDFVVVNTYLIEDLKKLGLWDDTMIKKLKYHDGNIGPIEEIPVNIRNKYKETFDIEPEWLIRAAAARGKWIDQSQSLNIYYAGTSGADIDRIYRYAWEMGLKTTYYLRTLAASQVEKSTVNASEFGSTHLRQRTETADAVSETPAEGAAEAQPVGAAATTRPIASNAPAPAKSADPEADLEPGLVDDPTCEACQ
jgi:ribonucleoside-diphosphate reductase alpha chain